MTIMWMLTSAVMSGVASAGFWYLTGSMYASVPAGVGIGVGLARYLQERANPGCESPAKVAIVQGLSAALGVLVAVLIIYWIESG
jgi:hypothetical protein